MSFQLWVLDDFAATGCHIVIVASATNMGEVEAIVRNWSRGTGNVTIRNAGNLHPNVALKYARMLKDRLTLEE